MKLFFINNDGGGFADTIEVAEGSTIAPARPGTNASRQTGRLPDSRQPPAGFGRAPSTGRGPCQCDHQDRGGLTIEKC